MRLRTVSPNEPGWTRRRAGKGFVYLDADGVRLDGSDVERIKALVIPPAWREVWICPFPNGHIQAVGVDVAGRRQYLYHPVWRQKRDAAKFDRILEMARKLPKARAVVAAHLVEAEGVRHVTRERVMACAVRLMDLGYFRIGNDTYVENGSYGLTTLLKSHVSRKEGGLVFAFTGKSGIAHEIVIEDPDVGRVVELLRRRRGGGKELLAFKDGRLWRDVTAEAVNAYLLELFGGDVTAKDFRTWHATVIAATSLAANPDQGKTRTARRRVVREAMVEVADYLGNTPAVARGSYVDPRVVDLYEDGTTIAPALRRVPKDRELRQAHLERAVLRMLSKAAQSSARVARTRRVA